MFYRRAIDADPQHASSLSNYAGFLLFRGRREEGLVMPGRATTMLVGSPPSLAAECWFYTFAHQGVSTRYDALCKLKRVLEEGARSPGWDLSQNIERAEQDGHTDIEWLKKLAMVITDVAEIDTLANWDSWAAC